MHTVLSCQLQSCWECQLALTPCIEQSKLYVACSSAMWQIWNNLGI